jgi:hypothetical protein
MPTTLLPSTFLIPEFCHLMVSGKHGKIPVPNYTQQLLRLSPFSTTILRSTVLGARIRIKLLV